AGKGTADSGVQVRQVTTGTRAGIDAHRARRLSPHPRTEVSSTKHSGILRIDTWQQDDLPERSPGCPKPLQQHRNRCRRPTPTTNPRPAAHIRGPHPAGLVSQGRGRRGEASDAVDLPGPPRPAFDLLVPV